MRDCSVTRGLEIVRGNRGDYEKLGRYHYRAERLGVYAAVFALKGRFRTAERLETVGVIVYTMPVLGCELRDVATGGFFAGYDRATRATLLNENIRCISRVVVEPRFRGLGLAVRLVAETMPLMNVRMVEAMAVMGRVNPFFAKAGMKAYFGPVPARCVRMSEAFGTAGIEQCELIDARCVDSKIEQLVRKDSPGGRSEREFIDDEMRRFLQSYGRRRQMPAGLERTRYVLGKLTQRSVYYAWVNPNLRSNI